MNDISVMVAQNQLVVSQKLVDLLKEAGYTVVIEKQAGINDIKNVFAYEDRTEARTAIQDMVAKSKGVRQFETI